MLKHHLPGIEREANHPMFYIKDPMYKNYINMIIFKMQSPGDHSTVSDTLCLGQGPKNLHFNKHHRRF